MAIITLTTDLGTKDFYQAALKGSIYKALPTVNIVDITHEIPSFDITYAAFVLKNAFIFFPIGTVHLIGIDSVYTQENKYLALQYKGHYFIGADNGIFSLMFEEEFQEIIEINIMQDLKFLHFPLADVFVKAAVHLAQAKPLSEIGIPIAETKKGLMFQPTIDKDTIRGKVIYIDRFSNAITNITKDLFTRIQENRKFTLYIRRNETINHLSWHYNEVEEGEKLCLFGISNYLEIAINKGKAAGLLGFQIGSLVHIEFHS